MITAMKIVLKIKFVSYFWKCIVKKLIKKLTIMIKKTVYYHILKYKV